MLEFQNHNIPGELWLRGPDGNKQPAPILLDNIYSKYQTLNPSVTSNLYGVVYGSDQAIYDTFYSELTSNKITRFDSFYDVLFIETKSGCIFEKIYTQEDQIKPFNISDNFTAKHNARPGFSSYDSYVDYWFDETHNRIFYSYIANLKENKDFPSRFAFALVVNLFDCKSGSIKTVLLWKVILNLITKENWDPFDFTIEPPKLTFNSTTRTFNVSFLLKNKVKQFGLISINFKQSDSLQEGTYEIREVNGHLPFFVIDQAKCEAYPFDPRAPSGYRIVTVSTNKNDPSYNLKFVVLDYWNEKDEIFEAKYLDIE